MKSFVLMGVVGNMAIASAAYIHDELMRFVLRAGTTDIWGETWSLCPEAIVTTKTTTMRPPSLDPYPFATKV